MTPESWFPRLAYVRFRLGYRDLEETAGSQASPMRECSLTRDHSTFFIAVQGYAPERKESVPISNPLAHLTGQMKLISRAAWGEEDQRAIDSK